MFRRLFEWLRKEIEEEHIKVFDTERRRDMDIYNNAGAADIV